MKRSNILLETIKPKVINPIKGIQAWFSRKNPHLTNEGQQIAGLNLGFNTDEKSQVIERNRSVLLKELNIPREYIAYADQVHGTRVQTVTEGGTYPDTDALVTQITGLALAIQVADCAAVLLADDKQQIIGAAHAGWRGAVGDILPNTINSMIDLGAQADHIKAFVSPCISLQHFEVGQEVAEQFPDRFVDYENFVKPHVDLKDFIEFQLGEMGLAKSNIEIHPGCTVTEDQHYYSYRREHEKSGRMLGIIRLDH